jgi:phage shock protein A
MGGMEAAKQWVIDNTDDFENPDVDFIDALIERIEELEAAIQRRDLHIAHLKDSIGAYAEKQSELENRIESVQAELEALRGAKKCKEKLHKG